MAGNISFLFLEFIKAMWTFFGPNDLVGHKNWAFGDSCLSVLQDRLMFTKPGYGSQSLGRAHKFWIWFTKFRKGSQSLGRVHKVWVWLTKSG